MKLTASALWRSASLWIVLGGFAVANVASAVKSSIAPPCCGEDMTIGFPFPYLIIDGTSGESVFYVFGLLLDAAVPLTVAVTTVWLVRLIRGRGTAN
jgi:hypothetical protein